jgi:release factor glutamine methyltransferase
LTRLLAHEPVQYVLGIAYFADMELEVTPATLIPRPETEELVHVIKQEQAAKPNLRVLDVGTGSGCLALALARLMPTAQVLAVDISAEALAVARRNADQFAPKVTFQQVDILAAMPADIAPGTLDILVSNPPYVRESERSEMRENVLAWEPATALFVPDEDPLLFYRRLAELGRALLKDGGAIYLEINEALGAETLRGSTGVARLVWQASYCARHPPGGQGFGAAIEQQWPAAWPLAVNWHRAWPLTRNNMGCKTMRL